MRTSTGDHHSLRRSAADLLRQPCRPSVVRRSSGTTDRMREHYSTVGFDEARSVGERVVSLLPALGRA